VWRTAFAAYGEIPEAVDRVVQALHIFEMQNFWRTVLVIHDRSHWRSNGSGADLIRGQLAMRTVWWAAVDSNDLPPRCRQAERCADDVTQIRQCKRRLGVLSGVMESSRKPIVKGSARSVR